MTEKVMVEVVENELYLGHDGCQIAREFNTKLPSGRSAGGFWVLRDVTGIFIDYDKYRHDLMERFGYTPDYDDRRFVG